ncbi:MAG: 3-phosphoshikimate 1-carboxyvinyltransferase, partial [Alistipes senegalensis]|nr:3-phosphoshikimate 1-carboxyvinyltransferase [Alistipes senegalensis]
LFTPIAALCDRPMRIVGTGSLLHRPMSPMLDTLRRLGAEITDHDGRLPLTVSGPLHGGETSIDGSISSQFVTGLLLTLPLVPNDTVLHIAEPVSIPYLDMTLDTAARFGIEIGHRDYEEFFIEGGQRFRACEFFIEGDWSAAAMLLVAGAVAGETTVENVRMLSKQADTAVCEALVRAGASVISDADSVKAETRPLQAFEFDATHCPDLFPALAALAAAAEGTSVLHGTSRLVNKECDRATAIREEYGKLGIEVELAEPDTMRIRGGAIRGGRVDSHGDHRMAMLLAVAALRADGPVVIDGAECVAKSFPDFFEVLDRMKIER